MSKSSKPSLMRRLRALVNRIQLRVYIFTHRSRREPFFLYDSHKGAPRPRGSTARLLSFSSAMALLTLLALMVPLRPSYSAQENRSLTPFPAFSLSALADGSFFSDLTIWFADTFPLRDGFLAVEDGVERLYGIQTHKITGQVQQADDIPDVPASRPLSYSSTPLPDEMPTEAVTEPVTESVTEPVSEQTTDVPTEPVSVQPTDAPTEPTSEQTTEDVTQAPTETPTEEVTVADDDLTIPELDDNAVVEKLSAVLSIDDAAFEYYNFVLDTADRYTAAIEHAAQELEGISTVYNIIVPNSMGICVPSDVQEQVNTSDQKKAIDYMYGNYGELVHTVPVYATLLRHSLEGEYLYFRTDHHWTALGAYRAYEQFCAAAGKTPTPLEDYIPHEYPGFLGTFYNSTKSAAMKDNPDTVYAYESPATNTIHIKTKDISDWRYLVIGNVSKSAAGNKYGTFIGGDNPFSYVENPDLEDGSAVMLIKESYGNAFAPFLIDNYQYTYIVDYRYISKVDKRNLKQLCEDLDVQDVIFLNTISTTRAKSLVGKLEDFTK